MPKLVPAWEISSNAYATWYKRPSGEKIVVLVSYLWDLNSKIKKKLHD